MKAPSAAVCSVAPLSKKLGIKEDSRLLLIAAPPEYRQLVEPLPARVTFERTAHKTIDIVHIFVTQKDELALQLARLRQALKPSASVWVSWPKKSSKVPTTVTEHLVRELAFPLDYVDIKICAVTEVWTAMKLVVRKALR